MSASLSEADLEVDAGTPPGPAEVVPGPTLGKLCLKAAYNSSLGFWELRLCENMPVEWDVPEAARQWWLRLG
jgi:hypothetical protein